MKNQALIVFALLSLTTTHGQADPGIETLYKTVHKKVERNCPAQLSAEHIGLLKEKKAITVGKTTYQPQTSVLRDLKGDTAYLCTGQYLKYSSSRPKVVCTYCNKEGVAMEKALVSVSVRVGTTN